MHFFFGLLIGLITGGGLGYSFGSKVVNKVKAVKATARAVEADVKKGL